MPTWISLLILIHGSESSDKLCKVSISIDQLSVGSGLCDPASVHHNDLVTLRQEPNTVSHKKPCLVGRKEMTI